MRLALSHRGPRRAARDSRRRSEAHTPPSIRPRTPRPHRQQSPTPSVTMGATDGGQNWSSSSMTC